jgi:hypothetical protein
MPLDPPTHGRSLPRRDLIAKAGASLEVQIALTELFRRVKNPQLLEDPPPYRQSPVLRGPRHLPLAIDGITS